MSILISCPSCQAKLQIPPENAGHVLRCPRCNNNFRVRVQEATLPLPPVPASGAAKAPPKAAPKASSKPAAKAAPKAVSKAGAKAAPKVSVRRPAVASGASRPSLPPTSNTDRTLVGKLATPTVTASPPRVVTPPPLSRTPPSAPSPGRGGLLRWVLLGCLLTSLLGGGGIAAFYFWKGFGNASTKTDDGNAADAGSIYGKWGIIEIGSKGIKPLVLDIFEAENNEGYDFRMPKVELKPANPNLVAAAKDGQTFDPKALDDTEAIVKQLHTAMREEYGLPPERIYIVSSSGLWVPFAKNPDVLRKNQKALADRVKTAVDCELAFITARQEAELGMKSCVPPKRWEESIYLDIGSGNVKGGCFETENVFAAMDLDFGSTTYTKKVESETSRTGQPFAKQAEDSRLTLLEQPLAEQIKRKPVLDERKRVDLAGGAVWALATFTHPNDSKARLELEAANIERYAALVRKPKDAVRQQVLAQIENPEQRKKMEKEIAKVQGIFRPENLQAGAEILRALSKVYRFRDKRLYFFRNSHNAWPLGYVLEKNKIRK